MPNPKCETKTEVSYQLMGVIQIGRAIDRFPLLKIITLEIRLVTASYPLDYYNYSKVMC